MFEKVDCCLLVSPVSSSQLAVLAFAWFCKKKNLKIKKEMHERLAEKTADLLVKWEPAAHLT